MKLKINKILFFNIFTITKNVGPLTFWLGPWIWNFRGPAGYWEKNVSLYPWLMRSFQTILFVISQLIIIFCQLMQKTQKQCRTLENTWFESDFIACHDNTL